MAYKTGIRAKRPNIRSKISETFFAADKQSVRQAAKVSKNKKALDGTKEMTFVSIAGLSFFKVK